MASNGSFKQWLIDDTAYVVSPLESFRGVGVGIDAGEYLHSILSPAKEAPEPLLPAHGGNGFAITTKIDDDLQRFHDNGITPWFVFNGLDLANRNVATVMNEGRKAASVLDEAWKIYDQGRGEEAVLCFGKVCTYRTYHILRSLMFHLHRQGVIVQIAPFTAASHLAYLLEAGKVRGIYGSASCLLYGCDQIILDFDWHKKQVLWTNEERCLSKLELTHDQFVAACLISGSSILPILPELDREDIKPKMVQAAQLIKHHGNIDTLLRPKENDYRKEYYRALFSLKHPLIFPENSDIRPKDLENAPSDYNEYVGTRLPGELLTYLSRGLLGPRVVNMRSRAEVLETPPLDGGQSSTYKDLVSKKLRPIHAQAIGILTAMLHRYYQNKDVHRICWFDEQRTPLGLTERADWQRDADSWHTLAEHRPKLSENDILGSGLMYAVVSLSNDADAKKTLTPRIKDAAPPLHEFEDARSNIVWRFLQDRGYINENHTLSGWGRMLKAAFDRAAADSNMADQQSKQEMEEVVFLAVELVRLDVLGTQQMFPDPPYSGGLTRGDEKDKLNAVLISRVACLGSVEHGKIGYTGPLSRSLLAYHQMIAAVREALRDLVEAHAGYIFMAGSVKRNWGNTSWTNLAASLPFVEEADVGLGLVVKSYLDELSSPSPQDIGAWFHHVDDIAQNLRKAWGVWDAINAGVQAADSSIVNSDTKMTFKNADAWLKKKLEHAKKSPERPSEPNGTA